MRRDDDRYEGRADGAGVALARWAELGARATAMEAAPEYQYDNAFRQEAIAARADAGRFVEEHFDELLAEQAADAVAAYEALERTEAAYQDPSDVTQKAALQEAQAAYARISRHGSWRALLETHKGRELKRNMTPLSLHEEKILAQTAREIAEPGRSGSCGGRAPRQVPMPRQFAEHLGLLKPILH